MTKSKYCALFILGMLLYSAIFAQKYSLDSLKIWMAKRNSYTRSIDSFQIIAADIQESQLQLEHRNSVIRDTINKIAKDLLIDRALDGSFFTGRSHNALIDSLEQIQTHIAFANEFLHERFDQCLAQIDSCMEQEKRWKLKIDIAIKHGAGKLPGK